MNKRLNNPILIYALSGITMGMMLLSSCGSHESKAEEHKESKAGNGIEVTTFPLAKGKLSSKFSAPGELIAFQQVDLYAKENSFVKKLYVDVGSEVSAGQLLATLEAPELNSRIAASESRLKSQEAIYTASKANYDRLYKTSLTPGTISPNDLDQAVARMKADEAQLEAARASNKEVTIIRNYLEIRAPFAGVISSRNVNMGAYVGPSGKGSEFPLFTLQEQKHLRLVVSVPEIYTGYLNNKNQVQFTVKSLPSEQFSGTITRLSGALDNRLRAERIEADVKNNDKRLLPGMVAEVSIPLPSPDSVFVVPKAAILNTTEGIFVIKVSDGKAEWIKIEKGREAGNEAEIFGSLQPGDILVYNATEEIRNGMAVEASPKQ